MRTCSWRFTSRNSFFFGGWKDNLGFCSLEGGKRVDHVYLTPSSFLLLWLRAGFHCHVLCRIILQSIGHLPCSWYCATTHQSIFVSEEWFIFSLEGGVSGLISNVFSYGSSPRKSSLTSFCQIPSYGSYRVSEFFPHGSAIQGTSPVRKSLKWKYGNSSWRKCLS